MRLSKKLKQKLLDEYQSKLDSGELVLVKDTKSFRYKFWEKQDQKCPILGIKIPFSKTSLDHKHRRKSDIIGGPDRLGLIRAVLHKETNVLEGKVVNYWKRSSLQKIPGVKLSDVLRRLADYYDMSINDSYPVPPKYVYPTEHMKESKKKLGKREYKKVISLYREVYPGRKKLPKRTKYLTKSWIEYIKDTDIFIRLLQENKRLKKQQKKGTR